MYATTLIAIFLLHLGFLVAFPAVWLTWRAVAPRWIGASERAVTRRPVLSGVVGLLFGGLWFLIAGALASAPAAPLQFTGVLGMMLFGLYAMAGVSAFAAYLGSNLPSPADQDRPWKATLRGGVALELTWILPIIGWFVLLPLSLIVGTGAATLGLFGLFARSEAAEPARASYTPAAPDTAHHATEAPAAALYA